MGDVHLSLGFIVSGRVEVAGGGGRHNSGKMCAVDCNDERWRCRLVAILEDILLVHVH